MLGLCSVRVRVRVRVWVSVRVRVSVTVRVRVRVRVRKRKEKNPLLYTIYDFRKSDCSIRFLILASTRFASSISNRND